MLVSALWTIGHAIVLLYSRQPLEKTNKHIVRIFQTGNSFGVRIPAAIAERYEFDRPGYALVQANGDKITVKRINEESLN